MRDVIELSIMLTSTDKSLAMAVDLGCVAERKSGYSRVSKGFLIFINESKKIVESRNAVFYENEKPFLKSNGSTNK